MQPNSLYSDSLYSIVCKNRFSTFLQSQAIPRILIGTTQVKGKGYEERNDWEQQGNVLLGWHMRTPKSGKNRSMLGRILLSGVWINAALVHEP